MVSSILIVCLFIGVGWEFSCYSLDTSVHVIIESSSITSLNLALLRMIDLIVSLWTFLSMGFALLMTMVEDLTD
jgi:hypothetical protein